VGRRRNLASFTQGLERLGEIRQIPNTFGGLKMSLKKRIKDKLKDAAETTLAVILILHSGYQAYNEERKERFKKKDKK
tara:strand:- start:143 stop:376 length:234 start_codon:yes stop_codon:yes gene_type:complete